MRGLLRRLGSRASTPPADGPRTTPSGPRPSEQLVEGVAPWMASSVIEWLRPFFTNEGVVERSYSGGLGAGGENRDFLREAERNFRTALDWRNGSRSAAESVVRKMLDDDNFAIQVIEHALANVHLGYSFQEEYEAVERLQRILLESGSAWEVAQTQGRSGGTLRRRTAAAASQSVDRLAAKSGRAGDHLTRAWTATYGRDPNPGEAYSQAIKAVEVASIPVVIPKDPTATLGKVVGAMRSTPTKWTAIFDRSVSAGFGAHGPQVEYTPVESVVLMVDLLWRNQTGRHGVDEPWPAGVVSQAQAEWAVHLALVLVHLFRSGAVRRAEAP